MEAIHPCKFASLRCEDFLKILMRHPDTWKNVRRDLGQYYAQTCEELRGST
jgi:hypothetical protein